MKRAFRIVGIAAYLLSGVMVWGQQQMDRTVQMRKLEHMVGDWKLKATFLEPAEVRGVEFEGTLHVTWTLRHTALEFRATGKPKSELKGEPNQPEMEAQGLIAFNDADFYDKQGFTGNFAWAADGRMVHLKGKFVGDKLMLDGENTESNKVGFQVRVTGKDPIKIEVGDFKSKKEYKFLEFTLSKS